MKPISDLDELLAGLSPRLEADVYTFCSVPAGTALPVELEPFATVRESEGLTLVLSLEQARRAGLPISNRFRRISLRVHSSLMAVGLTAAVAQALTNEGISANVIAGYHHDHILVPTDRGTDAMKVLTQLGQDSE